MACPASSGTRNLIVFQAEIWKEHGALDYWECIGDDLDAKDMVPVTQLAKASPDETVVFSWVVYGSTQRSWLIGV